MDEGSLGMNVKDREEVVMKSKNYYKEYKRGQVVYVDFDGSQMVSRDSLDLRSWFQPMQVIIAEHPQVTVCPLSSKLKDIKVHVKINPLDVNDFTFIKSRFYARGYANCIKECNQGTHWVYYGGF